MTGLPEVEWINSAMKSNDGNSITKHTRMRQTSSANQTPIIEASQGF